MYTPASFAVDDPEKLHTFIETHSFATLVSPDAENSTASHLPLLLDRGVAANGRLVGHMARANRQWEQASDRPVLAIFHGPHAYVSPAWYAETNVVPTWNYAAVHVQGTMRLEQDRGRLLDIVRQYVDVYEAGLPEPWSLDKADPEFIDGLLDAIVGFTIEIERIEGKWKLSQNHTRERREKVIHQLDGQKSDNSRQIAGLMAETLENGTTN